MSISYESLKISVEEACEIAYTEYGIEGQITELPGDSDFNFMITSNDTCFILKVGRPEFSQKEVEFQMNLLRYLNDQDLPVKIPEMIPGKSGDFSVQFTDKNGIIRRVRMLSWIEGRLWSTVHPITDDLLLSLGSTAGQITRSLMDFDQSFAHRYLEWDIAGSLWTKSYAGIFTESQAGLVRYFQESFENIQTDYANLRKSIVHNDINDHNVVVSMDMKNPEVSGIIDFGDVIYTQTVNDLAIVIAYAVMGKIDPLSAAYTLVKAYHDSFPMKEKEVEFLYFLVAMRLVISVTKSTLNIQKEPENAYHQISRDAAWKLLTKWKDIHPNLAAFTFRHACNYQPHPNYDSFKDWLSLQNRSIEMLFPDAKGRPIAEVDLSLKSSLLGHRIEFENLELLAFRLNTLRKSSQNAIPAGGYGEVRPFYTTDAFKQEGNSGPEYRTVHLGIDFWITANTEVHALFDGWVLSISNNDQDKDYGPTLILQHSTDSGLPFWTLYGHLSKNSLTLLRPGQPIKRGDLIAFIGDKNENGNWVPHLHFQLMLDMLDYQNDFPGVASIEELPVWQSICPDPNLIFRKTSLKTKSYVPETLLDFRLNHLGKSLSVSYRRPLTVVRGEGVYLVDQTGRKYLDTVNNVAHVGHEHPAVVMAGRHQMGLLNTNTRYLYPQINRFAEALLETFPAELCVVHVVNSGSEANELALRMAQMFTGQKDIIAMETGYHGNTNACINVSSYKFDGKGGNGAPEHTHIMPLPDKFRGIYRGEGTGPMYARHIKEKIDEIRKKGRGPAAFLAESIISCGGQIELPDGFLSNVYDEIRKAGALCIADEVQVGCGRVGSHFWAFQSHGVIPDIVTIGKPIGNGHPLAAVVCTREVADAFANGMEYFNTYGGNPVSCAIGIEVLKVIKEEKLQENAWETGNYLKSKLTELQQSFQVIGDVRGQGLFLGFELTDRHKNPLPDQASYLINRMRDFGILMSTDGKDNNVIKIKPPMVFSVENADELILRLISVLSEDYMDPTHF